MSEDITIRCATCGTPFIWTPQEQRAGPIRPTLCPACRLIAPPAGRQRGVVKWFNRSKGFGFITAADGPEVFIHKSGLAPGQPLLRTGQLVEYALQHASRGAQAVDVRELLAEEEGSEAAGEGPSPT
jgi:CspA family cold shock protein